MNSVPHGQPPDKGISRTYSGHTSDMTEFETFLQNLHEAMAHLYDPAYEPPRLLAEVLRADAPGDAAAVQAAIRQTIEDLRPADGTPRSARSVRVYRVLHDRYVQQLTQENVAERLGITTRHLRREQHEAITVLARHLWAARCRQSAAVAEQPAPAPEVTAQASDRRLQMRQELEALQHSSPGQVTNVADVLTGIADLLRNVTARSGLTVTALPPRGDLLVAVPPSALRQLLVATITTLAQQMQSGSIELSCREVGDNVTIGVACSPYEGSGITRDELADEIVAFYRGSVEQQRVGPRLSILLTLPSTQPIAVLVVEDNPDLVHLYRRYCQGTRFRIMTPPQDQSVLAAIAEHRPHVVLLDVMLPDVDGWELLTHLHEHVETRGIPIVVCSVVQQEALALALGAVSYLAKPVMREGLIAALEQAALRVGAGSASSPEPLAGSD